MRTTRSSVAAAQASSVTSSPRDTSTRTGTTRQDADATARTTRLSAATLHSTSTTHAATTTRTTTTSARYGKDSLSTTNRTTAATTARTKGRASDEVVGNKTTSSPAARPFARRVVNTTSATQTPERQIKFATSSPVPASMTAKRTSATSTTTATRLTSSKPFNLSSKLNAHHPFTSTPTSIQKAPTTTTVPPASLARPPAPPHKTEQEARVSSSGDVNMPQYSAEREPVKAYLRIRPAKPTNDNESYIKVVNDTDVLMIPPADHRLSPSASSSLFSGSLLSSYDLTQHNRNTIDEESVNSSIGTLFKFTSVFDNNSSSSNDNHNSQASFFRQTTLPLVQDFLIKGENCLLFAYGPTGSGKTWTVQGGAQTKDKGLLPRVMDAVWNSVSEANAIGKKSHMSTAVQKNKQAGRALGVKSVEEKDDLATDEDKDVTIKLEDGYDYSVWVSYAEIYNEKIYDLLESPVPTSATVSVSTSSTTTASSMLHAGLSLFGAAGKAKSFMNKGFSTVIKRNALSLKHDKQAGNGSKYIAGMKEICVHSAEEAQKIIEQGQTNRRVYGTLANRASSRSHAIFTIKLIKTHQRQQSLQTVKRFSIVDLAGSERVQNTGTTGDRLKEAGSINKSLMVLGQCMEVLRKNQEKEKNKKAAIVPFRHSKLTEMFQSFFVGDGKAAMIVNVNPWDTTFDENSHVMKFAAVAKGIMTIKNPNSTVPIVTSAMPVIETPKKLLNKNEPRVVRLSMVDGGEETDVLYEEQDEEEDDDEIEQDEFVNALLDELGVLRTALCEAQTNAIVAASQARSRTIQEYEQKLLDLERHYQERMREQALEAELKLNAKLDILTRLTNAQQSEHVNASRQTPMNPRNVRPSSTRTPVSVGSSYDDSDDEQDDSQIDLSRSVTHNQSLISYESDDDEEQDDGSRSSFEANQVVEKLLLTNGEGSFDQSLRGKRRVSSDVVSPTPLRQVMVHNDGGEEEEDAVAEGVDEQLEGKESCVVDSDADSEADEIGDVSRDELELDHEASTRGADESILSIGSGAEDESEDELVRSSADFALDQEPDEDDGSSLLSQDQENDDDDFAACDDEAEYHGSASDDNLEDDDDEDDSFADESIQKRKSGPKTPNQRRSSLPPLADENEEVELEVIITPKQSSARKSDSTVALNDVDEENRDPLDYDQSVVMTIASIKKPKRKLGGNKVRDADSLDLLADELHVPKTPSTGLKKSLSVRSFASVHKSAIRR
ncbi:hypothetical protein OIO90_004511 [Microbotryomycetes sp. JL221]|nr:hypothetical protein OIO90_004511 [Microbotryomycetes sp. JL221]